MMKKMAHQYISKVDPTITSVEAILNKEESAMLAPMILDGLKSSLADLLPIKTNATAVLNDSADELLHDDLKEVTVKIGAAKKQVALATSILATMARAAART